MAPHEHGRNGIVASELSHVLYTPARQAGLRSGGSFTLGSAGDFRVPDPGFHDRDRVPELFYDTGRWSSRSCRPGDETYAKFDFSREHQVSAVWVVDPLARSVAM